MSMFALAGHKAWRWSAPVALAAMLGCLGGTDPVSSLGSGIQLSSPASGVSAAIVGDRVQIRSELAPARYALFEQRYLEETLASYCFGSGDCGDPLPRGITVAPLVSSATGMSASATKLVVVWWAIPEEPPPLGAPTTPYKIVLDLP